jgi:UDP-2,3-diacylglucosamine hydrolase
MQAGNTANKIYFLSDFHLGAPDYKSSLLREKKIVQFLDTIKTDAKEIFIVGDIFDFWYEYKKTVPKYFVRLLGKLAELSDSGIKISVFTGNHDMWMSGYFEQELNICVYHKPQAFTWNNKSFFIGHGDGLGPGDHGYKFIKKIFRNPLCQWLFGILHPDWGISLANYFSKKSRIKTGNADSIFLGEEKEWLIVYCKEILQKQHFDYFIFGHRHYPIDFALPKASRYINLGDWITNFTYASFDGNKMELHYYK